MMKITGYSRHQVIFIPYLLLDNYYPNLSFKISVMKMLNFQTCDKGCNTTVEKRNVINLTINVLHIMSTYFLTICYFFNLPPHTSGHT